MTNDLNCLYVVQDKEFVSILYLGIAFSFGKDHRNTSADIQNIISIG